MPGCLECGVGVYGLGMSEEVSECGVRCVWAGDECGGVGVWCRCVWAGDECRGVLSVVSVCMGWG